MNELISKELDIYLKKVEKHSVKESWVVKYLSNLCEYLSNKEGKSISEKIYLLNNTKQVCKICKSDTDFLSYKRGYRTYCSKSCSNSDPELNSLKNISAKKNSLEKWGVDNPSKSELIRNKIIESKKSLDYNSINEKAKLTNLDKWGVDNPSKSNSIKEKKKEIFLQKWGVDNPFKSNEIKNKIKDKMFEKYGVEHPLKSNIIKNNTKQKNLEKWGVDNFTKTKIYKELIFEKYRKGDIKTNLNTNENYVSYKGLGIHILKCDNNQEHNYETNSHLYHSRKKHNNKQCTICFPVNEVSSFMEKELYEFVTSIYKEEIIQSYRDGLEIDIYIPKLKIGFEFNGLYWHSELFKDKNYHLDKSNFFKEKGIKIVHIWEDDWIYRTNIIKSQIKNWLGLSEYKIWARKCIIKEVSNIDEYRNFLNNNHIQGYISASVKLGLYYNEVLVSLMTFDHFEGRKKMLNNEWNLSRFCNKLNTNVIGGASKLLNYFIKVYNPTRIVSFADKSWSDGELYHKLGFYVKSISYPNYSYLIDKKRSNKQKWKKSNLIKMGFDKNLSESKIMEDNFGSYKIFDCGQIKFEIII
jgi:hypothetical protein